MLLKKKKGSTSKSENTLRQMKINLSKVCRKKQKQFQREVYSYTDLPQKTCKISNNLTYHPKKLEKEEKTKSEISKREEIIKYQSRKKLYRGQKIIYKIKKTKG